MIDITFEANDVVLKFPKQFVSLDYVQNFLERSTDAVHRGKLS